MVHEIDIVIFGITGYTGIYCLRKLIEINKTGEKKYKLGTAGRNEEKVIKLVNEICKELEYDETCIKIIKANVEDKDSLLNLAKQCKIIINCVGPYQLYGRQVVEACVEAGTHHVDLSGEPQYLEKMQLDFHEKAKEKGIFIIGSCGFDSIPTDCGIDYLKNNFKDVVFSKVEGFIMTRNDKGMKINIGTFHSLLESISNHNEIKNIRRQLYPKISTKKFKYDDILKKKMFPFKMPFSDKYFFSFFQTDKSVLRRTEMMNYELDERNKPVQFEQYIEIGSYFFGFILIAYLLLLSLLSKCKILKKIMVNFPELFTFGFISRNGPTREQVKASKFSYYLCATGKKNDLYVTKTCYIEGPEIAYDATAIFIVSSAITILEDLANDKSKAGVLTPGFAFRNTNLIERTKKLKIRWELF